MAATVTIIEPTSQAEASGSMTAETEVPIEATETIASSAVEIAEIEADRDIQLAEIAAETTETLAKVEDEDRLQLIEEGLASCQQNIATQATEMTEIKGMLASILERLPIAEPAPASPPAEVEVAESVEVTPANQEARAEEPVKKRKWATWI